MDRPPVITDASVHTMSHDLLRYLEVKVHHVIAAQEFECIVVSGAYDRNAVVSRREKSDKRFNWQRPTVIVSDDVLHVGCPPGKDYVMHYGGIIGTYLALRGRRHEHVLVEAPTDKVCNELIYTSNLRNAPKLPCVVTGYGLEALAGNEGWTGEGQFQWKTAAVGFPETLFVGCRHSVWGDIAGRLVAFLASELGVRRVIYVGKLGALKESMKPNEVLATGNSAWVEGCNVEWSNPFGGVVDPVVVHGRHFTSPSTLLETVAWLSDASGFDFVDPEIGHMARAAVSHGIEFGYIHIVSNNLSRLHPENLSNERSLTILQKRQALLGKIATVVGGLPEV